MKIQKTDAQMIEQAVKAGRVTKVLPPANAVSRLTKRTPAPARANLKPAPVAPAVVKPQTVKPAKAQPKPQPVPVAVKKAATVARLEEAKQARAKARVVADSTWETITRVVPCACGCGETVEIRRFKPGHDAKLFSRLLQGESLPPVAVLDFDLQVGAASSVASDKGKRSARR